MGFLSEGHKFTLKMDGQVIQVWNKESDAVWSVQCEV